MKRTLVEALSHLPGEVRRAEQLFGEMGKQYPNDIKFLSTYADFLVRYNRHEQARAIYRAILSKEPGEKEKSRVYMDLARSYRMDRNPIDGLSVLDEFPVPNDPYWLLEKGHCLIETGMVKMPCLC